MSDEPSVRPALAWLQAVAVHDEEAMRILAKYDTGEIIESLTWLTLCFIRGVADDPQAHIQAMFTAAGVAERGNQ